MPPLDQDSDQTYGRFPARQSRYGPRSSSALSPSTPVRTSRPAALRISIPAPELRGSGSSMATTTLEMPRTTSVLAQEGVLPWNEQGSSVTYAVTPDSSPGTRESAIASAWCSPGFWVKPLAITWSPLISTQPTGGLGRHSGNAFRPSRRARFMKCSSGENMLASSIPGVDELNSTAAEILDVAGGHTRPP